MRHRGLRTAVTAISVAISTIATILPLSAEQQLGRLLSDYRRNPMNATFSWAGGEPLAFAKRIEAMPGVTDVIYLQALGAGPYALDADGKRVSFQMWAPSSNYPDISTQREPWFLAVSDDDRRAWAADHNGFLLTSDLMSRLKLQRGQKFTWKSVYGDVPGVVSGEILGDVSTTASVLMMHYDHYDQELAPPDERGFVEDTIWTAADPKERDALIDKVDAEFAPTEHPTVTFKREEFLEAWWLRGEAEIPHLLGRIAMLLVGINILVTASALAMSLNERRADFGVLRALGFTRGRVFRVVMSEALLVCGFGGLIGAGIPFLLFHSNGFSLGEQYLSHVTVAPAIAAAGFAVAIAIGLLAGMIPAILTSRLDVATVLQKA